MFQNLTIEQIKKQGFVITSSGDKFYLVDQSKQIERFAIEKPKHVFDTYKVMAIGKHSVQLALETKDESSADLFLQLVGENNVNTKG